ncbi:MAG: hypothetical protein QM784_23630 [Polyangiaceae bacterium]
MTGLPPIPIARLRRPRGRRLAAGIIGVALTVGVNVIGTHASCSALGRLRVPNLRQVFERRSPKAELTAQTLTPELRHRGYNECYPYDFVGLGPYSPFRKLRVGRIAIPQKGGYTEDYGYDVVVHFHGQNSLRMTLAQVARGVAFVGIDFGQR